MEARLTLAKKIGNFVSSILLGDTKEVLVRMDERLLGISKKVESIENEIRKEVQPDLKNIRERLAVVEDRVGVLWRKSL